MDNAPSSVATRTGRALAAVLGLALGSSVIKLPPANAMKRDGKFVTSHIVHTRGFDTSTRAIGETKQSGRLQFQETDARSDVTDLILYATGADKAGSSYDIYSAPRVRMYVPIGATHNMPDSWTSDDVVSQESMGWARSTGNTLDLCVGTQKIGSKKVRYGFEAKDRGIEPTSRLLRGCILDAFADLRLQCTMMLSHRLDVPHNVLVRNLEILRSEGVLERRLLPDEYIVPDDLGVPVEHYYAMIKR